MKKKVLAYSVDFQRMYFNKDLFMIPYYVARGKGLPLEFCYGFNMGDCNIPNSYRGVQLRTSNRKKVSNLHEFLDIFRFILPQASNIDTLFVVGISFLHLLRIWIFKKINKDANVLIFGDMEPQQASDIVSTDFYRKKSIIGSIKQKLADFCFNNSILLVANPESFKIMKTIYEKRKWEGLVHFYPCLDDELCNQLSIQQKAWDEKENIIVCVGRIGCYQKNTEMILNALQNVDLKDWKIYMIGPITATFDVSKDNGFQKIIDQFFIENPKHVGKLIFTGPILDTKTVLEFYNRAKVLLMTSRHESYGNVYSEAAAMGCYIVSTDVGGASLTSNNWEFGTKIEQENSKELSEKLTDIVNNRVTINPQNMIKKEKILYSYLTNEVILPKLN